MKNIIFEGKIWQGNQGENDSALFLGYNSEPLAERFEEFKRRNVTIRYWISEKEQTKQELKENTLLSLSGSVDANYNNRYSEYTGYLWTDEDLKVGGHDLLNELRSNVGKFLYMEVNY